MSQNNFSKNNKAATSLRAKKSRRDKREPRPPKKITSRYLHNSGQYYLQRFTASSGHFKTVMMRKIKKSCAFHKDQDIDECEKLLDEVVAAFCEMGLLDDQAYTRGMVSSLRRKGLSAREIHRRLAVKKVPKDLVAATLAEHDDTLQGHERPDFVAAIKLCKRKRIGPFARPRAPKLPSGLDSEEEIERARKDAAFKDKQRQMAALARAGFSYDIVSSVMDLSDEDAEDMLYASGL